MSKIICDVCGTAYPETSMHCPICGSVSNADAANVLAENSDSNDIRTYTYVKGGRFSKSNVRKRNRANQATDTHTPAPAYAAAKQTERPQKKKKNNTGLVITAIVLLLAIVAVVIYLALKLFWPELPENAVPDTPQINEQVEPSNTDVACESLMSDVSEVFFSEIGVARMIYVTPSPSNTTDTITYTSSDESVATVTDTGKVIAVGPGEAIITISCGDVEVTCTVICQVEDATDETTQDTTEEITISEDDLRLNREDITFSFKGEEWMLYSGEIDVTKITWTSDNESVATIENGTVKAVGVGTTTVYAEYAGVKVSCIIRCSFTNSDYQGVGGHGGVSSDEG